jgi:hypothetical protein
MKPDTARFLASFVVVACVATITILGATGYSQPEGYIAAAFLAVFAFFVALTQDP